MEFVQIIMAIEEKFKIVISLEELVQPDTVGKVVDVVYARLRHTATDPCPPQQGFYRVRKALMEQFGLDRAEIKPERLLNELVPQEGRPAVWETFMRTLTGDEYTSAALVRPKGLDRIVVLLLPAIAFFLPLLWLPFSLFWLGFFPALIVLCLGARATTRWKTLFPPECSRVRDLVPFVKTLDSRIWTKDEVFEQVQKITVEYLGVKPEQVKPETCWIKDLAVD